MKSRDRRQTRCSFCGKSQDDVKKLVAGPGVYICDQCVALCNQIIAEEPPPTPQPGGSSQGGWIRRTAGRLRRPGWPLFRLGVAPTK